MSQSQVLLSPFQLASATDGVVLASSEDSDLRSPLALRFLDGRDELEMDFVVVVVVVTEVVVVGSSSSASNRTVFFSCLLLLLLLLLLPPAIVDLEADVGILVELMQATPLLLLILRLRLWWR
jgi:hypothetical protein